MQYATDRALSLVQSAANLNYAAGDPPPRDLRTVLRCNMNSTANVTIKHHRVQIGCETITACRDPGLATPKYYLVCIINHWYGNTGVVRNLCRGPENRRRVRDAEGVEVK